MKTKFLTYALVAAGLLCGATFQAAAQQGGGGGRGMMILSQEDRTAVQEATRDQLAKLRTDLQAAQKAAVEAALSDAKDENIKAKLEAVSKIQNEMAMVYCKAVKKAVKFTDEQTTRMKESPMIGYMTLFGPGGFGGRGGARRGAGGGGGGQQ